MGNDIGVYPGRELEDKYHFQALQRKGRPMKMGLRIEPRQNRASTVRWKRWSLLLFIASISIRSSYQKYMA